MRNSSDLTLHQNCEGCTRITEAGLCSTYLEPIVHWRDGRLCSFHPKTMEIIIERTKKDTKFYDPLKASKMKAKGKK